MADRNDYLKLLATLLDLQQVSSEIVSCRQRATSIAQRLATLQRSRKERLAAIAEIERELATLTQTRQDAEQRLQATEDKLGSLRRRTHEVRTPKECDALQHEIERLEHEASRLQDSILELLDREQDVARSLEHRRQTLATAEAEETSENRRLQTALVETEKLIRGLENDEARLLSVVGHELAHLYTHLRNRHGLPVIVPVREGACSGCGTLLPISFVQQLSQADHVEQCPACRRIVFSPFRSENDSQEND